MSVDLDIVNVLFDDDSAYVCLCQGLLGVNQHNI